MHPALARLDHRPWPHPELPWTWHQSWCDLLFAHGPVPATELRPLGPGELEIQEFDGSLYARSPRGRIFRVEVHHRPWPLQRARAELGHNDLFRAAGLAVSGPPPPLHFSRRLDVVVWPPVPIRQSPQAPSTATGLQ